MRTGTTLRLQSTDGMEPLGAFNQPVSKSFGQIRAALLNELGPRYADYFSRPDFDSDGRRIAWIAQTLGEPRRWIDLSPQEQAELEPIKREIHDGFTAYVVNLSDAPENTSRSNFAKILSQALQVPDLENLYFVGDQPMVTFWGFKRAGQPEGINPLTIQGRSFSFGPSAVPRRLLPLQDPDPSLVMVHKRPWRNWLLWLVGGLLLLFFLIWLFYFLFGARLGLPALPLVPFGGRVHEQVAPALPPVGGGSPVMVPGAPSGNAPAIPSPSTGAAIVPSTNSTGVAPPHETMPPELPKLPDLGAPVSPGRPLALPPGDLPQGAAAFMAGLWRNRSGLRDGQGKPLEQLYRFDNEGQGDVTVRGVDGSECHGSAQAVVALGGQLVIREAPKLTCNQGGTMSGAETHCATQPSDGTATCKGINSSNGSSFDVQMEQMPGE